MSPSRRTAIMCLLLGLIGWLYWSAESIPAPDRIRAAPFLSSHLPILDSQITIRNTLNPMSDAFASEATNPAQIQLYHKRINAVYDKSRDLAPDPSSNFNTPTPDGWEAYDGSRYTPERGYGWLTDRRGSGRDRGLDGIVVLPDGTRTTPRELGRPELATTHGMHQENIVRIFRIDLPNGWYRVTCTSIDPSAYSGKPLVDLRSFKCRAQDAVFAGSNYGEPLAVRSRQLIEGSGIVEVTNGHLRLALGDPAYTGWTWKYPGPWYKDLRRWWRSEYNYYANWYERLTRTIDPGFHSFELNALQFERIAPPLNPAKLIFRDFFNRDDSSDINTGVTAAQPWMTVHLAPWLSNRLHASLHKTSIQVTNPEAEKGIMGLLQPEPSPAQGIVRYSTRVTLVTGQGSQKGSGIQEAGIVLLTNALEPSEFNSTFVGVSFHSHRTATKGWLVYRVGDGEAGYRTDLDIPDTKLPFSMTEGEHEIIVEHDVDQNVLRQIKINTVDVTHHWPLEARAQRLARGLFGIRSAIHNTNPRVKLKQHYWYYRVEAP